MKEDKSKLMQFAMQFGYILGGFWIFKYLFIIFSKDNMILALINNVLSVGTPILLFYALVKYQENISDKKMSYWHGIQFGVMLFFFASILEAVIMIVHTVWIDPGYISRTLERAVTLMQTFGFDEKIREQVANQSLISPFTYVFNAAMSNVLIGTFLSLFIVPASRYFQTRKDTQPPLEDNQF